MPQKLRRGFAAMDPEEQRAIAQLGGQAAHASGHAHEFTTEEARQAGTKGGLILSQDRTHMSRIGIKGGKASWRNKRRKEKAQS
jgi:general stress protein YciG